MVLLHMAKIGKVKKTGAALVPPRLKRMESTPSNTQMQTFGGGTAGGKTKMAVTPKFKPTAPKTVMKKPAAFKKSGAC